MDLRQILHFYIIACWPCQCSWSEPAEGTHRTVFHRQGALHEEVAMLHLRVEIPLLPMIQACSTLESDLRAALNSFNSKETQTTKSASSRAPEISDYIKERCSGLLRDTAKFQNRPKRSILLGAVGALFGLLGLEHLLEMVLPTSAHNVIDVEEWRRQHKLEQVQIAELANDLNTVKLDLTRFVEMYAAHGAWHKWLRQQNQLETLFAKLDVMRDGLGEHRLPRVLLSEEWVENALPALRAEAAELGGRLPFQVAAHVFQAPTSYVVMQDRWTVFVHLPIVSKVESWDLFVLQDSPILARLSDGAMVAYWVRPHHPFIAVSPRDHTGHIVLTQGGVDRCLTIGRDRFCPHLVVRRNFSDTCIGKLYSNDLKRITEFCPTELELLEESVTQTSSGWSVFLRRESPVVATCDNGTRRSLVKQGAFRLSFEPGCTWTSPYWSLLGSPKPVDGHLETSVQIGPSELDHWASQLSSAEVEQLMHRTRSGHRISLPIMIQIHDGVGEAEERRQESQTNATISLIICIALTILVLTLGLCTCYNCRHKLPRIW